ncbi:MAG: ABC transporter ATP-binding protein, partial [Methanosarcinales archaeon]
TEKDNIHLDIMSGVIDKAILTALSGKRCLILTNGGMIGHTVERIKEYAETSGIAINVSVVGAGGG